MVSLSSDIEITTTMMFVVSDVDPGCGDLLYWTAGRHHHSSHTEGERWKYFWMCQLSLPGDVVEETEHWG